MSTPGFRRSKISQRANIAIPSTLGLSLSGYKISAYQVFVRIARLVYDLIN